MVHLMDLMVRVEKINEEKRKLEVMVKIFGRKTPLELSYMQVDKSLIIVTNNTIVFLASNLNASH